MIKLSIHQGNTIILNGYESNNRASKFMEQKLIELKEERDKSTIMVEDFDTVIDKKK